MYLRRGGGRYTVLGAGWYYDYPATAPIFYLSKLSALLKASKAACN